jgi:hypothetical protein
MKSSVRIPLYQRPSEAPNVQVIATPDLVGIVDADITSVGIATGDESTTGVTNTQQVATGVLNSSDEVNGAASNDTENTIGTIQ